VIGQVMFFGLLVSACVAVAWLFGADIVRMLRGR
jgi:hypothetical protein